MGKIITIHQPEHLPWCGYFNKMRLSDHYVILDDVQYKKNNFQNRNRIISNTGVKWLTVPVQIKGHINKTIEDMLVVDGWEKKYYGLFEQSYKNHPYFIKYKDEIKEIIYSSNNRIIDINMRFIEFFRAIFKITTPVTFSSSLSVNTTSTPRLVDICSKLNGDEYLAGIGSYEYLDTSLFNRNDIKVSTHEFQPMQYSQLGSEIFIPYMSCVDLIMNVGIDEINEKYI
jgi:hypothetical protein